MSQKTEIRRGEETVVVICRVKKDVADRLSAYAELRGMKNQHGKPNLTAVMREVLDVFVETLKAQEKA